MNGFFRVIKGPGRRRNRLAGGAPGIVRNSQAAVVIGLITAGALQNSGEWVVFPGPGIGPC